MDKKMVWRFVLALILTPIAVILADVLAGQILRAAVWLDLTLKDAQGTKYLVYLLSLVCAATGYFEVVLDGIVVRRLAPRRKKVFSIVCVPVFLIAWCAFSWLVCSGEILEALRGVRDAVGMMNLLACHLVLFLVTYITGLGLGYRSLCVYDENANQTE